MQKQFTKDKTLVVKGVAIILLLMYHLFQYESVIIESGVVYSPLPLSVFHMLAKFGNICVAIFVFLTAYGITKGLLEQGDCSIVEAYKQATKRFVRLVFDFAFVYITIRILLFVLYGHQAFYAGGWQGFVYGLTDGLGMNQFFDTPTINQTWWYMKLAYVFIFLVPVLAFLSKKMGNVLLLLAFFAPAVIQFDPDVERYWYTAVLGVCAANGDWITKMINLKIPKMIQWLVGMVILVALIPIRQNFAMYEYYVHIIDAPIAMMIVVIVGGLWASVPLLNKGLMLIGKYSMIIFLVHSFFYQSICEEFIYRYKYAGIILLLLLVISLVYAVVVDGLKVLVCKCINRKKDCI